MLHNKITRGVMMFKFSEHFWKALVFLILFFLTCLFIYHTTSPYHNWGGDYSCYIMQAKSILNNSINDFIIDNTYMTTNSQGLVGPIAYPWGLPILLAISSSLFGDSIIAFKAVPIIMLLGFFITLFFLFRDRLSLVPFVLFLSMNMLNINIITFSNHILSDLPFLFFSTLSISMIDRIYGKNLTSFSIINSLLLAVIIFISVAVRSNGVLLLCILPIVQLIHYYKYRMDTKIHLYIYFLPYLLFIVLYTLFNLYFPSGGLSHISFLKEVSLDSIARLAKYNFLLLADIFPIPKYSHIIYGMSIILFCVGVYEKFKEEYIFFLYGCAVFCLYCIWPFSQGLRFLFPLIPFYCYFFVSGLVFLFKDVKTKQIINLIMILTMVLYIVPFSKHASRFVQNSNQTPYSKESQEIFNYIRNTVPKDAIITFFKPRVMRLYTDRMTLWINNASKFSGDYICVYKYSYFEIPQEKLDNMLRENKIKVIFANAEYTLYRRQ